MEIEIKGLPEKNLTEVKLNAIINNLPNFSYLFSEKFVKKHEKEIEKYIAYLENQKDGNTFMKFWLMSLLGNSKSLANISKNFDDLILPTGLCAGELYTISAISGGGKTAFCSMLTAVAISGINPFKGTSLFGNRTVVYVSLEQSRQQIEARIISTLSALNNVEKAISYAEIVSGYIPIEKSQNLKTACSLFDMFKGHLKIVTTEELESAEIEEIEFKVTQLCNCSKSPCIAVIDQFVNIKNANDPTDETVVNGLKRIATINRIPVIVQTQLNKSSIANAMDSEGNINVDKITGNALRGTSNLENQSSLIFFLVTMKNSEDERIVKVKSVKNRYGALGEIKMRFTPKFNLFQDFVETRGRKKEEKAID